MAARCCSGLSMIPSGLFRASHSHNPDRIRSPHIFFENGCLLMWYGSRISGCSRKQACIAPSILDPWYHNIIFSLCTQKYHCVMVLITIFSAAISVFLFTMSSICARCTSDSSAALTTTSTASPLMLTTASLNPFA